MIRSAAFTLMILGSIFLGCSKQIEPTTQPLTGLWSLHIMEQQDSTLGDWKPWKGGMQGFLLYDGNGNMALHLMTKGYQDFDLVFPNFTENIPEKALKHLTNSYVYFANYTIDTTSHIVTHQRISHSNPDDWGKTVQRRFSFNGDTLVLAPVEKSNSGLRLKWLRETSKN